MAAVVKSAQRVIEVFEFFAERRSPATLTEVSRGLGYPPSSTSALLKSLQHLGYLDYDHGDRTFVPTLRAALLGIWVNDRLIADGTILRLMHTLCDRIGDTVVLGAQSELSVQYIHVVRSLRRRRPPQVMTGHLRPLLTSAVGQVILSTKSDAEIVALARRINAEEQDSQLRVKPSEVLASVDRFRREGYAHTEGMFTAGSGIVAMLLAAPRHQPPLALGIGAPLNRFRERMPTYVSALRNVIELHRQHMERDWARGHASRAFAPTIHLPQP